MDALSVADEETQIVDVGYLESMFEAEQPDLSLEIAAEPRQPPQYVGDGVTLSPDYVARVTVMARRGRRWDAWLRKVRGRR